MSLLSDIVRRTTGQSIGQNIGTAIGGACGGDTGALIGRSVGGSFTEAIDPTNRTNQGQGVARSQATQTNPQESQNSGTTGGVVYNNNIMPASFSNIPMPPSTQQSGFQNVGLGGLILGGGALISGAAAVIDLFYNDPITGQTKRKKITRKFKSQVKQSVELVGLEETARMLNTEPEIVVQILLKRFRNDGPYITKAAVRKTRSTVKKMEQVNMLSREIAKLAGTTARRSTTRKTSASAASRKTTVIQ